MQEVFRIEGLLQDADLIGELGWVLDPTSKVWWPGEVLDPMAMPLGRTLPRGAVESLTLDQKVASLPFYPAESAAAQVGARGRGVVTAAGLPWAASAACLPACLAACARSACPAAGAPAVACSVLQ